VSLLQKVSALESAVRLRKDTSLTNNRFLIELSTEAPIGAFVLFGI